MTEATSPIKKVLIATPSYDGRLDVWYTNSLVNSIRVAQENGIFLHPVFMSYDALIQRARNDLLRLGIEGDYDSMIWIDSDMEFNPMWVMEMITSDKDVLGGCCRKKTDDAELYNVKTQNLERNEQTGFIKVESIGTGFIKLSRKAMEALWKTGEVYSNENREGRLVFEVKVIDGELVSEDNVMCRKLTELGFDIWLAPHMTCAHIGNKKFRGNFENFVARIKENQNSGKTDSKGNEEAKVAA